MYFWVSSLDCFHACLLPSLPVYHSTQLEIIVWSLVYAGNQMMYSIEVNLSTGAIT